VDKRAKLTERDVKHVYYLLANTTMSQKAIAEMMGVTPSTISRVANRKTHQRIPGGLTVRPRRRGAQGERAGKSKLDAQTVRAIRLEHTISPDATQAQLAEKHGVSQQTISDVLNRNTWDHVS
jgi:transcriptional regulator with XRE-family HTH domain